jgi:hypothetical protein
MLVDSAGSLHLHGLIRQVEHWTLLPELLNIFWEALMTTALYTGLFCGLCYDAVSI